MVRRIVTITLPSRSTLDIVQPQPRPADGISVNAFLRAVQRLPFGSHVYSTIRKQKQLSMPSISERQSIGFITVRLHPEHGYFGGLLLVNHLARPLEFHCTLPVKPSRAQSILYGPTLDEFICGEQIARALALKVKSAPIAIFTDTPAVLSLRNIASEPIVLVDMDGNSNAELASLDYRPTGSTKNFHRFKVSGYSLAVLDEYVNDAEKIQSFWQQNDPQVDLREPFGRIADALLEAHPTAKAA